LILAGANINQQDKIGWTTLHHAVQRYNLPATHLLLKSGVDLEMKDDYGNTPLLRAVFESNGKGEIIKLLLNSGADIYNKNDLGINFTTRQQETTTAINAPRLSQPIESKSQYF